MYLLLDFVHQTEENHWLEYTVSHLNSKHPPQVHHTFSLWTNTVDYGSFYPVTCSKKMIGAYNIIMLLSLPWNNSGAA